MYYTIWESEFLFLPLLRHFFTRIAQLNSFRPDYPVFLFLTPAFLMRKTEHLTQEPRPINGYNLCTANAAMLRCNDRSVLLPAADGPAAPTRAQQGPATDTGAVLAKRDGEENQKSKADNRWHASTRLNLTEPNRTELYTRESSASLVRSYLDW